MRGRHLSSSRKTAKQAGFLRSYPCRRAQVIGASLKSWAYVTVKHEGSTPAELDEEKGKLEVAELIRNH